MIDDRLKCGSEINVLVCTGAFPALSETFVLDQVLALNAAGMNVSILAFERRTEERRHLEVDQFGLEKKTTHISSESGWRGIMAQILSFWRLPVSAKWRLSRLALAAVGASDRKRSRLGRVRDICQTMSALAATPRPDVAICHFGQRGDFLAAAFGCLGYKCPVMTIFHGYDMSLLPRARGWDMYDDLFRSGALFLAVTNFWRSRLLELGSPPERTRLFRMGVDVAAIIPRDRARARNTMFTVLSTGRLIEKKGHEYAIRALAMLKSSPIQLIIAGDGPLRITLQVLAETLGVSSRVKFLGGITRDEVQRQLAVADAFVLPSVTAANGDMEGLPVSLMEAMAVGVPVVSTRHSGIPELIEHGESGLLTEEKNVVGLATCLSRLMSDSRLANALARQARKIVQNQFNIRTWNELLLKITAALADQSQEPLFDVDWNSSGELLLHNKPHL